MTKAWLSDSQSASFKQLRADALCQLMFWVMHVSLEESLMRARQEHCAWPSRAENVIASNSMIALVTEERKILKN